MSDCKATHIPGYDCLTCGLSPQGCVKCGRASGWSVSYIPFKVTAAGYDIDEHLEFTCLVCGYKITGPCMDAKKDEV